MVREVLSLLKKNSLVLSKPKTISPFLFLHLIRTFHPEKFLILRYKWRKSSNGIRHLTINHNLVIPWGLPFIEHTISDNVFTGKRLFERIADRRTIGFSIIEGAGAAIWLALIDIDLALVGIAVLAAASFIEHNLAVNLALRKDDETSAERSVGDSSRR